MHQKTDMSIGKFLKAFTFSWAGLKVAFAEESAFKVEVVLAVVLLPAVYFLPYDATQKALMSGSIFLVLIIELINSAIESAIDRISDERHPLSKKAKDTGSAAVLVACVNVIVIWVYIIFA